MNLKTLLLSMLIIAIACITCTEARSRSKSHRRSSSHSSIYHHNRSHHRTSGHSTSGHRTSGHSNNHHSNSGHSNGIGHHAVDGKSPSSPDSPSKQQTHTGNVAAPHTDVSHNTADSYPKQQTHTGNEAAPHTDASHNNNQPVYNVNSQHQNTHSTGNDDFADGFATGLTATRRRHRNRRTTTTPAPTTAKTPCLNEAPMQGNNPQQQQHNPTVNCEAVASSATELPIMSNINTNNIGFEQSNVY